MSGRVKVSSVSTLPSLVYVYRFTVFVGCSAGAVGSSVAMFSVAIVSRVSPSIPSGMTQTAQWP